MCENNNINKPATANRTWAMTNGWEALRAILVAVEAEAHRSANKIPAPIHLYWFLILLVLVIQKFEVEK